MATAGPGVVGRVTTNLNLRAQPSTNAAIVATLPTNTIVTVTGYSVTSGANVFIPVSTPYGNGWVASQYVTAIGTATPTRTSTATRTRTAASGPSRTCARAADPRGARRGNHARTGQTH